ncbi:MAG TPA: Panacea domain-containing protein [Longimicrobium sp.]|nr:Panacea domain-containing protein [Longimicrobium sp.]
MNYMKLIKLLYLSDRRALVRWGRPISFARPLSMRHGPVLSEVLDLINEGSPPGTPSFWTRAISSSSNYEVRLNAECSPEDLSDAEEEVLAEVYQEYGGIGPWPLVEMLHRTLPEWTPTNGAIPIRYRDILLNEGWTEAEVEDLEAELEETRPGRPSDVAMKVYAGRTFTLTNHPGGIPHLWIVVTEPSGTPPDVAIVSLSSERGQGYDRKARRRRSSLPPQAHHRLLPRYPRDVSGRDRERSAERVCHLSRLLHGGPAGTRAARPACLTVHATQAEDLRARADLVTAPAARRSTLPCRRGRSCR